MSESAESSSHFIDEFAMWTSLIAYAGVWTLILSHGGERELLPAALATALSYVGGHVYTMLRRGRGFIEADLAAVPVALAVAAVFAFVPSLPNPLGFELLWLVILAVIPGHIAAIAYMAAVTEGYHAIRARRAKRK